MHCARSRIPLRCQLLGYNRQTLRTESFSVVEAPSQLSVGLVFLACSSAPSVPGRSALSLPSSRPSHNASKKSGSQAPSRLNLPSMSPSRRFRTLKKSRDTNCRKSANKDTGFALSLPSSSTLSQKVRLDYSQIGSEIGTAAGSARKRSRICVKSVQDGSSLSLPLGSETSLGICKSQGSDFGQGGRVGNNSSKKRKAEVLDEVPPAHGTGSAGNQVLWWTCTFPGCKYEVWRTPGSHHHTSRKWTHLRNTHKVPVADIPRADSSDVVREAQANRKKLTWKYVLPLLVKHKSIGDAQAPWNSFCYRLRVSFQVSSLPTADPKKVFMALSAVPMWFQNKQPLTRAQRSKLWRKRSVWLRERKLSGTRPSESSNFGSIITCDIKKPVADSKAFLCAPVALDTVWWKCPWCDYKILVSDPGSTRTTKRQSHLFRLHGVKAEKLPTGNPLTAPHRVLFCQEYFDKRWALQYQQFQKHKWKGAHDIQQDVCFVRPYQSKTGKQEVNIYHKCNTCGLPVQRNRVPVVICPTVFR